MSFRAYLVLIFVAVLLTGAVFGTTCVMSQHGTSLESPTSEGDSTLCPPLDPPTGTTVTVATVAELQSAVASATAGTTILVAAGTYNLSDALWVTANNVAIRGATGDRDDVILDGGGMLTGSSIHVIAIDADDVTIADLTIRNADEHGVSIQGRDRPLLYNLRIVDTGNQLVKVNPIGDGSDDGELACSTLEYTTTDPNGYTNGISAHNAHGWTVRDNRWTRIRTLDNSPAPAILFWSGSSDTVVARNLLVDCYQGIALGNAADDDIPSHTGGVVRNNVIVARQLHDVAIEMVHATGWLVAHNTAWLVNPVESLTWGMEARFAGTEGTFAYNLTNMDIWADREGAAATVTGNVTDAEEAWFVDAANADLHVVAPATAVIDQAATLAQVPDDFDGDARPIGDAPDIGADEVSTPSPPAASLHLEAPVTGTSWPVSHTQQIRWTTTGVVTQVALHYTHDAFASSQVIVSPLTNVSPGIYTWTTPASPTQAAQVRIVGLTNPAAISDTSGLFTLYDPATFSETVALPLVLNQGAWQPSDARLHAANLVYQGGFAYPTGDEWSYSGHALAYYPAGDPTGPADGYPGSLYAAAHDQQDLVGEISIPAPVVATDITALPTASVLRSLTDITGGWKDNCTYAADCIYREVDGLAYLPNVGTSAKIAWNLRDWYNTTGYDQDSLGWSDLDMRGGQGVWHIGPRPSDNDAFHNGKTSNYLFNAPAAFADEHLGGRTLIAGSSREAGALGGSQGPTLYALAPWNDGNPPVSGQPLDALALLYYPERIVCVWEGDGDINERPDPDDCQFPAYRAKDSWGGGAWVEVAGRRAVLIAGQKALGDNCYGTPEQCANDPCHIYKGYHAYPYQPQILFYDPAELLNVVAGTQSPWEVLPYEVYVLTDEMLNPACAIPSAVAYDNIRRLLYITEREAGPSGETVVHVWRIQ